MRVLHTAQSRRSERRPFQGAVQVSWQSRSGETRTMRGKCLDISDDGARIECELPLDFRSNVFVKAPAHGLMGNATVRYCRSNGIKHVIGLMFSSALSEGEMGRKRVTHETPNAGSANAV